MILKIKNNKINHFLITKKPETNLVFYENINEVILFISNKKRIEIMKFLNEQLSKISKIKIISIFRIESKSKNIIAYDAPIELTRDTKLSLWRFIKNVLKIKFNMLFDFEIINFNISNKNKKKFSKTELSRIINRVLSSKEEEILPAYPKPLRREINRLISKYNNLKAKTSGQIGERKIRIIYKSEN
ncbi:hypothetical protein [Spiroplasma cantharicola]|uniref:R3H domain-containing protein n=1 Tax=Spiroplasma cantharicola TaxID=362837 RepID=A0A0M3SJL1_9MOLU|nr:hypothetical protein [Spiroplasma cantharicola]ALD66924.1 hypothetical protein SCANT_v1c10180 [Spiroplasma cantharicola]